MYFPLKQKKVYDEPDTGKDFSHAPFHSHVVFIFYRGAIYRYQPAISGPSEISPATPRWKYD